MPLQASERWRVHFKNEKSINSGIFLLAINNLGVNSQDYIPIVQKQSSKKTTVNLSGAASYCIFQPGAG